MAGRLAGKVAVITGTGRGMARQVALRFAAEGASVVGCDLDAEAAEETVALVRAAGGAMESRSGIDLTAERAAHDLLEFAAERFGGVDILDNNSMQLRPGPVEDLSQADWRFTLDHTLTAHFLVSKHAIPHLRARGGGSIIFMGSVAGANLGSGFPAHLPVLAAYAVAKAGVIRLSSVLANELAPWNIRVNTISPAGVATPSAVHFYGEPGSGRRRIAEAGCLVPRLGEPEDIASAAVYLASDESSWVTGHELRVDGGHVVSGGGGAVKAQDMAEYAEIVAATSVVDHWPTGGARADA